MSLVKYFYGTSLFVAIIFVTCVYVLLNDSFRIGHYRNVKDLNYISPMSFVRESTENNYTILNRFHRKITSDSSENTNNSKFRRKPVGILPPSQKLNSTIVKFKKDYPNVIKGERGNDFENLTLVMDSTDAICEDNSTFIIAVVPSAINNYLERDFIRKSWADNSLYGYTKLRTVFLLGETEINGTQKQIEKEAETYRDIIQMNYIDSYRNLTYKTLSALLWVSENCKDIPWVLKIDDDVIMNPFQLREFLEAELSVKGLPNEIMGRLRPRSQPFRKGKWMITKSEYSYKFYPPFVLGSAYIIGRNAVERLINAAFTTPFFPLEDVFTTGIVATKAKVALKNIEKTHFVNSGRSLTYFYKGKKLIFNVGQSLKRRKYMWKQILRYKPNLL